MDTEVAPIAVENLPALHAVHSAGEVASEYVPARQGKQVDSEVAPTASE